MKMKETFSLRFIQLYFQRTLSLSALLCAYDPDSRKKTINKAKGIGPV
jgi:hypothetical protein